MVSAARPRDERGVGTVLAVAMFGVLSVVAVAVAGVVAVVGTHRAAQSGADLAALAGAGALQDGADACARASSVAARNRTRLTTCAVEGWTVAVVVTARTGPLPGGPLELRARARAGPAVSAPAP